MSEKEITDWVLNKLNCCYKVTHPHYPHRIFWIYDEQYIRRKKLCKIENTEISIPNHINGICLFVQDTLDFDFYCNSVFFWSFIEKKFSQSFVVVKFLMSDILAKKEKLSYYSAWTQNIDMMPQLKTKENLNIYE